MVSPEGEYLLIQALPGLDSRQPVSSRFQENLARPAPAAMLRIVTGDNVYTAQGARIARA